MKHLRIMGLLAATLFSVSSQAAEERSKPMEKLKELGLDPESVVEMPVNGMMAYQAKNGTMKFITKDGRYVFSGPVTDLWARQELEDNTDIEMSAHTVPLDSMGIDVDLLDPLVVGEGDKVVHIITDPLCPACKKLNDLLPEYADEYTFKILALPALGDRSRPTARKIACETDREKAVQALLSGDYDSLADPQNCNLDAYKQALFLADYIGVREVPFLIGPNDIIQRGLPRDFGQWLASASSFIRDTGAEESDSDKAEPVQSTESLNDRLMNSLK